MHELSVYMGIMRYIKYIIPVLGLLFAITSCGKKGIKPSTTITTGGNTTTTSDTKLDTDELVHSITLNAPAQFVSTNVVVDTLVLTYYENVHFYIPTSGYVYSYALHLIEDFSSTSLATLNYTTYNIVGDINYDFVDDNLNDVSAKSVTDTTLAGVPTKNIIVERPFIFKKFYASNQAALMGQDSIDAVTNQTMNFHAYVYFTKTYPATSEGTNIYYVKQQ
jgi:hypothetical protein